MVQLESRPIVTRNLFSRHYIEDRIKDTDNLIDKIVYNLYGLTPAEIKLAD